MRVKTVLRLTPSDEKLVRALIEQNLAHHQEEFGDSECLDEQNREVQMENLLYQLDNPHQ